MQADIHGTGSMWSAIGPRRALGSHGGGARTRAAGVMLTALALGGCALHGHQSALDPAGPQSGRIVSLWWFLIIVSAIGWLAVVVTLAVGAVRAERSPDSPERGTSPEVEHRLHRRIAWAVAATVVILFVFMVLDFRTGAALTRAPAVQPLEIDIVGHQWWWEARYADSSPQKSVTTANELHIPVGRPVVLQLRSSDVIHSIWIPNLNGKKDLIPGYVRSVWFQADTPGVYRGQCAEFCGDQHAKMGLVIFADPPQKFAQWLAAEQSPASPPSASMAERGQAVFLAGSCPLCHRIAGTPAQGGNGPDLTHFASRTTIAAGMLPNSRGVLAGWVLNAQQFKPGVKMPPNPMGSADLQALLVYLEQLR